MHTPVGSLYRFGPFQVNSVSGELWKNGNRVKLQEQPFRLLVILLENAGEVVTRDDLRHRIWRDDTFVDFDSSLRVAVGKLREALGDDAENPRYVETIPKRGYRFLAPETYPELAHGIGELGASPSSAETAAPDEPQRRTPRGPLELVPPLDACIGLVAHRRRRHRDSVPHLPAAASAGAGGVDCRSVYGSARSQATSPAFSPDGSRIAFAWNGDPKGGAKGFDLYVKALGSETLLRLTQHPSETISPAWSPDGTQIAFHRLAGADSGNLRCPCAWRPRTKVTFYPNARGPTSIFSWHNFTLISWSPDGKSIAFADGAPGRSGCIQGSISSQRKHWRPNRFQSVHNAYGEGCQRSPTTASTSHTGVFEARMTRPFCIPYQFRVVSRKRFHHFGLFQDGLTWSADDKRLIYSLNSGGGGLSNELGEVTVANGSTKQLAFAGSAELPTVSPKGDKLAYSSVSVSSNIWRRDLLHPESPAVELIPSSRAQFDAQYSPDGKRIAFASLPGWRAGCLDQQ